MPDAWSVDYISTHWRKLEAQSRNHSIFQSWNWISCWIEIAKKHVHPILFKIDGQVIGICFIGKGKSKDATIFSFKTLYPFQAGDPIIDELTTEYNAVLCADEYKQLVHEKLVEFLISCERFKKFPRILLNNIPENHLEHYQSATETYDLALNIYKNIPSTRINLEALRVNKQSYDHHFSQSFKADIKRSEKLYTEKYGPLKIERPDNVTQAQNWFQELGKLHKKRFQQNGQNTFWNFPEIVRMQRAFLNRNFTSGAVEIIRVCAGTTPIGYLYNFIYRDHVYFYLSGFRFEEDNRFKPGFITHNFLIKDHYDHGKHIYDFMAGDQPYKYRMGTEGPTLHHLTIDKKTFKLGCVNVIGFIKSIFKK